MRVEGKERALDPDSLEIPVGAILVDQLGGPAGAEDVRIDVAVAPTVALDIRVEPEAEFLSQTGEVLLLDLDAPGAAIARQAGVGADLEAPLVVGLHGDLNAAFDLAGGDLYGVHDAERAQQPGALGGIGGAVGIALAEEQH